jgi:hypothetical protein
VYGVGQLTALTYVLTLGSKERFQRSRDVGCYLGLRPRRSQSGDHDPQLGIAKAGNVYLRTLLVECASGMLIRRLDDFLASVELIEPTVEESTLAAEFESLALAAALPLDAGESQLCAVLVSRNLPLLVTGDKRAITALESLVDSDTRSHSDRKSDTVDAKKIARYARVA